MIYPTIGIPALGTDPLHHYLQYRYTRCLHQAGAQTSILPLDPSPRMLQAAIERCDGFLFPGGPDIQPVLYEQLAAPGCGAADRKRDAFELSLLHDVLSAGKPLFCIGRGMQLLNVAFGGTLIQDIKPRQEYAHMDPFHRTYATHPVEVDTDSLLGKLLGTDTVTVNSLHHQAPDDIGEGLWIAASSPEGFPEALELEGYPFCLAVQWHPEHMTRHTPLQKELFTAFVAACRSDHGDRPFFSEASER